MLYYQTTYSGSFSPSVTAVSNGRLFQPIESSIYIHPTKNSERIVCVYILWWAYNNHSVCVNSLAILTICVFFFFFYLADEWLLRRANKKEKIVCRVMLC